MTSYSNARTTSIIGGVLTGIGIMAFSTGVASDVSSTIGMTAIVKTGTWESYRSGSGLRTAGVLIAMGGTVIWIAGGARRRNLKPLMISRGLNLSITMNPGIGYEPLNNSYFPSLGLNFRF